MVAGLCQGVVGFGFSLIAVPLLSLFVDPQTAVVVGFLHGLTSSSCLLWDLREHADWHEARPLGVGAIVGMPFGALVLRVASEDVLRAFLGGFTCLAAIWLLLSLHKEPRPRGESARLAAGVGVVSGFLNTSLSTNGPPLVLYLRRAGLTGDRFRGTISAVFTISNLIGLPVLLLFGVVRSRMVGLFLVSILPVAVGGVVGARLSSRLRSGVFRIAVDVLLLVGGILAVAKSVTG